MTDTEALEALQAREPIFHRPEFGTSRAHFESMTDRPFGKSAHQVAFMIETLFSTTLSVVTQLRTWMNGRSLISVVEPSAALFSW